MYKKCIYSLIVLVLVSSIFLTACSNSTPSTEQPSTPSSSPDTSEQGDVIELIFTHTVPNTIALGQAAQRWMDTIEDESNGRVKFTPYFANSLFKPREILRGTLQGQADISYYVPNIDVGLMKLNSLMWLPYMPWPSVEAQSAVYPQLLEKFPQMKAEYQGLKLYGISGMPPSQIHTTGKEVRVPSDFKGLKICASSSEVGDLISAAGAAPVNITVTDYYTSLERGMLDGFINVWGNLLAFKCIPLLKYHANALEGGANINPQLFLVNSASWDRLPPDIQKIFNDYEHLLIEGTIKAQQEEDNAAMELAKQSGHTLVTLTASEMEQWYSMSEPIKNNWISINQDDDGREIYEEAYRLTEAYISK